MCNHGYQREEDVNVNEVGPGPSPAHVQISYTFAEGSGNQTRPRRAASLPARRLRSAFRVRYQMHFRYVVMGGFPELVIFLSLCMTDHSSVKPNAGRGSLAISSLPSV